jgi:hypothetical protein
VVKILLDRLHIFVNSPQIFTESENKMTIRHLSGKDIKDIRKKYFAPTLTRPDGRRDYISMAKLAAWYDVSQGTIQSIIDKKGRWSDENTRVIHRSEPL